MRFIDLFAGLGGFHEALAGLGHTCVFACEIDPELARIYESNFGLKPHGDIRDSVSDIPPHDVLCAGFPCQPFSKAGGQLGFDCPDSGDLFDYVLEVLERHQPRYVLLENVPNILRHDKGKTWATISDELADLGYVTDCRRFSPHMFGVPQIRDRAFIVGRRGGLQDFVWPEGSRHKNLHISLILDKYPADARKLSPTFVEYLTVWQELIAAIPQDEDLPSFPIWAMEFGANYPLRGKHPLARRPQELSCYSGAFGQPLAGLDKEKRISAMPPYAREPIGPFPDWKVAFIEQNRAWYSKHKDIIDRWLPKIRNFAPSFQKLEWNWKGGPRDIWRTIVQFRASGIRAKRPTAAPSLVALTTSQVPVITWESRYMTPKECARLQALDNLKHLPTSKTGAFRALGNAVNVKVVSAIATALLRSSDEVTGKDADDDMRAFTYEPDLVEELA